MIREFNQEWEQDYVRKTAETLQVQADRRKSVAEKNTQRTDIDEAMGEGGGDEEEDLDELLGMSTVSMDFDVTSVEGETQLQTYM